MRTVTYACIYAMLTCVLVSAPDVLADGKVAVEGAQSQASNCWVDAGQRYGIEPWLEHFEWLGPLFNEQMHLKDGRMHVSDRPGLGFSLSEQAIAWTTQTQEFGKRP